MKPTAVRVVWARLLGALRLSRRRQDLDPEIETHLAMLTEDFQRRGLPPADARDAAHRAFGSVDRTRIAYREQQRLPALDAFVQDVRFAFRHLAANPRFTLTMVMVLGIGIGVNNMLFTLFYTHTLRGLPIAEPHRVLDIATVADDPALRPVSFAEYEALAAGTTAFDDLAAFGTAPVSAGEEHHAPDRFLASFVTPSAFDQLGIQPVLGRGFVATDDRIGAPLIAILSGESADTRFGSAEAALGRTLLVNGVPASVVGIMASRSGFPSSAELLMPLAHMPGLDRHTITARTLRVFGRLKPAASDAEARAQVQAVDATIAAKSGPRQNVRFRVVPINERHLGRLTEPAWLAFMAAGILVALISCANAASLMLTRAQQRSREIAVRTSLGASRGRIVLQLLTEGFVLACLGGAAALALSMAGVKALWTFVPPNAFPYWLTWEMDGRVFAALVGVSCATVVLFGLLPAIRASRTDVTTVLGGDGRSVVSARGSQRWLDACSAVELALTVVLVSYVVIDFQNSTPPVAAEEAVNTPDIVTASLTLPAERYRSAADRAQLVNRLHDRLASAPDVSASAFASMSPLGGGVEQQLEIDDAPATAPSRTVSSVAISPEYFHALGLTLTYGRDLRATDGQPGQMHALVNSRFVAVYSADRDPIGRRVRLTRSQPPASPTEWMTIIGVTPDLPVRAGDEAAPIVYLPLAGASPATVTILLRGASPDVLAARARAELLAIDATLPLYRVLTLPQAIYEIAWLGQFSGGLVRFLSTVAMLLSLIGLYAVTSHAVAQRTREIGLRMALGARPGQVRRMVLRRGLLQVVVGLVCGVLCTMAWDAAFFSGRVDVRFARPAVLLPVAAILTVGMLIACIAPVRRATAIDPIDALRQE